MHILQTWKSPLLRIAENLLLSRQLFTLLSPSWLLIGCARVLWKLRNHGARLCSEVPLLNDAEQTLMGDITELRYQEDNWSWDPHASLLHSHFVEQGRTTPLSPAFHVCFQRAASLSSPVVDISYSSTFSIAINLATELRSSGVTLGSIVPLILTDRAELAISMVAVLLAGAAFAVFDPNRLEFASVRRCMDFARVKSSVILINRQDRPFIGTFDLKQIDPRDIIESLIQEPFFLRTSVPITDLPTVVEDDLAFVAYTADSLYTAPPIFVTHREATEQLGVCMQSHQITSTSKVLFMCDCPVPSLQGVFWNVFALGGTICSVVGDYDLGITRTLHDLQCTHVCLPTHQVARFSSLLANTHEKHSLPLHTLIVHDDLSAESQQEWKEPTLLDGTVQIIKYGHVVPQELPVTTLIKKEIHVVYHADHGVQITPENVLELITSGVVLYNHGCMVVKITDALVVKCADSASEAFSMTFVREHTDIPVPRVHLVFRQGPLPGYYIVMDYIHGNTLERLWDGLNESTRGTMFSQLGEYLCQLRALENPSSRPGPVDGSCCSGRWFGLWDAGPFTAYDDLVQWLNHKRDVAGNYACDSFTTEGYRLVFTHQDLAPRNLILDEASRLWILDWGMAGWYPTYFEYASVASMVTPVPKEWVENLLPYLGQYENEYRSLERIFSATISRLYG
ncbi:hypothetical protein Hypma_014699 [Hypsizygus marmoreus]|uniref:Uncharacterized protein n=1 Tax=Hypsizygus marmoreus TaxID=39966 RepID=A0A369JBE7_HYPMA|nr:hypothetical protein Hypma_014699 [Hypsizygus marmoreus]